MSDELNGLDDKINARGFFERYDVRMNTTDGLCECGCGEPAPIIAMTNRAKGYVKGESHRFICGHANRGKVLSEETRAKISAANKGKMAGALNSMYGRSEDANPFFGKKHSEEARSKMSRAHKGKTLSEETRRKMSESRRGEKNGRWVGDDVSYDHLHQWLLKNFPKTGVCSQCKEPVGAKGQSGTHWANQTGVYSRHLADYRELCPTCHRRFDAGRARG